MNSHSQSERPVQAAPSFTTRTWQQIVRDELQALIRDIVAVEARREEAERLVRVLQAYGETDIPVLPWVPKHRAAGRGNAVLTVPKYCRDCGRTLTHAGQYRLDGAWPVCKKRAECEANRRRTSALATAATG